MKSQGEGRGNDENVSDQIPISPLAEVDKSGTEVKSSVVREDREGKTDEDEDLSEKKDEGEDEEARRPDMVVGPRRPAKSEVELHELTHICLTGHGVSIVFEEGVCIRLIMSTSLKMRRSGSRRYPHTMAFISLGRAMKQGTSPCC